MVVMLIPTASTSRVIPAWGADPAGKADLVLGSRLREPAWPGPADAVVEVRRQPRA